MEIGPAEQRLDHLATSGLKIVEDMGLKRSIVMDYVRTLEKLAMRFADTYKNLAMTGSTADALREQLLIEAKRARQNAEAVESIKAPLGEGEDAVLKARKAYFRLPEATLSEGERDFLINGGNLIAGPIGGLSGIALATYQENQLRQAREQAAQQAIDTFDDEQVASAAKLKRIYHAIDPPYFQVKDVAIPPPRPRDEIVPAGTGGGRQGGRSGSGQSGGSTVPSLVPPLPEFVVPDTPIPPGPGTSELPPSWSQPGPVRPIEPIPPPGTGSGIDPVIPGIERPPPTSGGPSIDGDGGTSPFGPSLANGSSSGLGGFGGSGTASSTGLRGSGTSHGGPSFGFGLTGNAGTPPGTPGTGAGAAGSPGMDSRAALGGPRTGTSASSGAATGRGTTAMMPGGAMAGGGTEEKQERKKTYKVPKIEPSRTWSEKKPLPPTPTLARSTEPEELSPEHLEATRRYEATRALKTIYRTPPTEPAQEQPPTDQD